MSSRGAKRRSTILSATLRPLSEVGYDGLSIDAVAASAGSSKTTVYRNWSDKRALACAAVVVAPESHPRMPSTATDLRTDLRDPVALMAGLGQAENAHIFASLLAAAQKDGAIAETLRVSHTGVWLVVPRPVRPEPPPSGGLLGSGLVGVGPALLFWGLTPDAEQRARRPQWTLVREFVGLAPMDIRVAPTSGDVAGLNRAPQSSFWVTVAAVSQPGTETAP